MELMQLEMFVAVVEERSIRGAAERVFRTQPAVSIAMGKLHEEIGAALFDLPKRREYRLTPAGEALYSYATRLLSLRNDAVSAVAELSRPRTARLRIGANESMSVHLLPQLIQTFLNCCSGVQIDLRNDRSAKLLMELKAGSLDLALLSFMPCETDLESRFIVGDELVLITKPDHPFSKQGTIHIRDLGTQPVIVTDISSAWHKAMMEALVQLKTPLKMIIQNASIETIKKMVAIGIGVGFAPLICVKEEKARGELAVVAISGFCQQRSLYLVSKSSAQSHAVKVFRRIAASFAETLKSKQRLVTRNSVVGLSSSMERPNRILMVKSRA